MRNGFTLQELLIALAIIGILAAMGVPSYRQMVQNHRANAGIFEIYQAIQLAKSEAIKRNRLVTLCPSVDGKSCDKDWSKGYVLFVDLEENGILGGDDAALKFYKPLNSEDEVIWKNFQGKDFLQLTPLGTTNYQNGTFYYKIKARNTRTLIINKVGRMRFGF